MLFSEALDSKAKAKAKSKKDKQKEQADRLKKDESDKVKLLKDYPFIADEMLAMSGIMNDLSPEELDAELASFIKTGQSDKLTLEQVIELQRAKMRSEGRMGTPVTEESLAAWKKRKADKKMAEIKAKVRIILFLLFAKKDAIWYIRDILVTVVGCMRFILFTPQADAEMKKKKGGKGLSVLNGKELFQYKQELFVDDDEADDDVYERRSDADEDEEVEGEDAMAGPDGSCGGGGSSTTSKAHFFDDSGDAAAGGGGAAEESRKAPSRSAAEEVKFKESLYLDEDDDLDDLDDLSDED